MTIEAITNEIQQFFNENGLNYTVIIDFDFGYYWETREVAYTLTLTERFDRLFQQFLTETYTDLTAPLFIWSLFHEVGHGETDLLISDDLREECEDFKDTLDGTDDTDTMKYYNCADERLATDWAHNYIKEHYSEVKEFWNRLYPMIEEYYEEENN